MAKVATKLEGKARIAWRDECATREGKAEERLRDALEDGADLIAILDDNTDDGLAADAWNDYLNAVRASALADEGIKVEWIDADAA